MDTAKPHSTALTRSALNVSLVAIEAIMTLVLRLDPKLRRVVYPLVKTETLVCIRTYLPHTQFYATFTYKGVLLDDQMPAGYTAPHVTINAYTHQLLIALFGQNKQAIYDLQMHGKAKDVLLVKDFLAHIGAVAFIQTLLAKFGKAAPKTPEEAQQQAKKEQNALAKAQSELDTATKSLNAFKSENQRLATELHEIQGKQKFTFIAFLVATFIAFGALLALALH